MIAVRIVAILLIVAGILGLLYGGIPYTRTKHDAKLGSLELVVKEKRTLDVPVWAGIAAIVLGGILLFAGGRRA